jgi:hypothetical protein
MLGEEHNKDRNNGLFTQQRPARENKEIQECREREVRLWPRSRLAGVEASKCFATVGVETLPATGAARRICDQCAQDPTCKDNMKRTYNWCIKTS